MLRLAIIGAGWAGTRQAEAIGELGGKVVLHCLVDSDEEHLRNAARELGVEKTYTSLDRVLTDTEVDAVSICTPHALHVEMGITAARAGKHVLCEKPLATSVEDAARLIEAAEAAGVTLYVAENACYSPLARTLQETVRTGRYIGEVVAASVVDGFRGVPFGYPGRRDWLGEPRRGGSGTWLLQGIHTMAQLRYVLGEVDSVYMHEHHARSFGRDDIEGTMAGLLTMRAGFAVSVVQSAEVKVKGRLGGYRIYGDRGSLWAHRDGMQLFSQDLEEGQTQLGYDTGGLSDYALELEAFADYVNTGTPGPTTAESERRSLAVVQAGYESAASGRPVHLESRFGKL